MLKVLLMFLSTLPLLALSLYIYLAISGKSETLYSTKDDRFLSIKQKGFLILAAIGFLVCMCAGAESMLFGIPILSNELGLGDAFQELNTTIAIAFALLGGTAFVGFIDKATHEKFLLRDLRRELTGLDRIEEVFNDINALEQLKSEYEKKLSELRGSTKNRRESLSRNDAIDTYFSLVKKVDRHIYRVQDLIQRTLDKEKEKREEKEYYNVVHELIKSHRLYSDFVELQDSDQDFCIAVKEMFREGYVSGLNGNILGALTVEAIKYYPQDRLQSIQFLRDNEERLSKDEFTDENAINVCNFHPALGEAFSFVEAFLQKNNIYIYLAMLKSGKNISAMGWNSFKAGVENRILAT